MAIDKINPFIQSTQSYYRKPQINGYHQAYTQGAPSTLPTIEQGYKPATEDYEKALAYINGDYKIQSNPYVSRSAKTTEKPEYENFSVPEYNGTGQLIPKDDNETRRTICYA